MKKIVFLLFVGGLVFASCEKDPDFSKLDENFIVLTKYDKSYDFKSNDKTFYISDTITLINDDPGDNPKWSNNLSQEIIDQIKGQFESFGYTYVADPSGAGTNNAFFSPKYLVSVTVVKDLETVLYYYYPYWYDYYDWWWWGGYYPYYPYYPYATGYQYSIGTTLIEMIDMQTQPTGSTGGHPIRWNAVLSGMLNTGNDQMYEESAIDDAFNDSKSYLYVK